MAERFPALLGKVRHHRREGVDEHVARFGEGVAQVVGDLGVSIAPTAAESVLASS